MTPDPDVARHIEAFNVAHNLQQAAHQTVISYLLIEPPRPAVEAARRSRGWAKHTCKVVQTVSDYEAAISDMMSRGLLWEIDDNKRSLISEYLDATPALGPIDGMPEIGTLQMSIHLASLLDELWSGIDCERPGVIWACDWQSDKVDRIYSPTRKGCLDFLRDGLADDGEFSREIQQLSGPHPCGPWRCQWWRKYESGHVLEIRYV
jgi:hypothetical protein